MPGMWRRDASMSRDLSHHVTLFWACLLSFFFKVYFFLSKFLECTARSPATNWKHSLKTIFVNNNPKPLILTFFISCDRAYFSCLFTLPCIYSIEIGHLFFFLFFFFLFFFFFFPQSCLSFKFLSWVSEYTQQSRIVLSRVKIKMFVHWQLEPGVERAVVQVLWVGLSANYNQCK